MTPSKLDGDPAGCCRCRQVRRPIQLLPIRPQLAIAGLLHLPDTDEIPTVGGGNERVEHGGVEVFDR